MSPDLWIGIAIGLAASAMAAVIYALRPTAGDVWDWSEQAYEPEEQPRAVTRLTSSEIDWEIR